MIRWEAERALVWSSTGHQGSVPDLHADADSHGCRWPESFRIPIGANWRSGFHHVRLRARRPPDDVADACFVVRPGLPERAGAILVLATNTYNAYNTWGGKSLYTGGHRVSFRRPFARGTIDRPPTERDDRKARPAYTGEEPDIDGPSTDVSPRARLSRLDGILELTTATNADSSNGPSEPASRWIWRSPATSPNVPNCSTATT
ncbi:MAG: DUF6605 domain-containing protein [Ilumatobacteraceae bacterium]